jgi:coenzyme F420-reducing hydrogenase alpha subunit
VEGHGDLTAKLIDGKLQETRFAVTEAPRFFEAFLLGHHYEEVTHMASRICGICAVSHNNAALKATEAALGVEISDQTRLLRRLSMNGELLGSHALHIYFLALPDFFGVASIFELLKERRDDVLRGIRLKKLGYDLSAAVVGRHIHPVSAVVGGYSLVHSRRRLSEMRDQLEEAVGDIRATARLYQQIALPDFERETEYVSLRHPYHYAIYDGDLYSSEGHTVDVDHYKDVIREYIVPYSTAKYARWNKPHFMVGALARLNNNFHQLSSLARESAENLGLRIPCFNPFKNTLAQIVECAHCVEESIGLIDILLRRGIKTDEEQALVPKRAGAGIGAVEAPRGVLFHEYHYDENGKCTAANQVIPTAQNLANLEADLEAYAATLEGGDILPISNLLSMLVRSYDPCISCSTHLIKAAEGRPRSDFTI